MPSSKCKLNKSFLIVKRGFLTEGDRRWVKKVSCKDRRARPVVFDNVYGTTNELEFQGGGRHMRRGIVVRVCAWKNF